jgi:hypothetical protein
MFSTCESCHAYEMATPGTAEQANKLVHGIMSKQRFNTVFPVSVTSRFLYELGR